MCSTACLKVCSEAPQIVSICSGFNGFRTDIGHLRGFGQSLQFLHNERGRMSRFNSKTVLITGGHTGIGFGIAERFAREGADLVLVGRSKSKGDAAVAKLNGVAATCRFLTVDLSCENEVREMAAGLGQLDVLVNNAGLGGRRIEHEPGDSPAPAGTEFEEQIRTAPIWSRPIACHCSGLPKGQLSTSPLPRRGTATGGFTGSPRRGSRR